MSKRDDDSQADLEVGMTTAERRRRRRRGGGLRVPSDNVPRRSTPPVAAPVPEDPSLAMSIAYSFTSDASEPVHAAPAGDGPGYADPAVPELIATVIDPPSEPVEQADFEMKTREMSAVDLEELGLSEVYAARTITGDGVGGDKRYRRQERAARVEARPESSEELDVEIAEVEETTTISSPPPREPSLRGRERLKTVALTDDDLEEVREVVRSMETAERTPQPAAAAAHGPARGHAPPPGMGHIATPSGQGVVASPIHGPPSGSIPLPAPPAPSQLPLAPQGQTQQGAVSSQLPLSSPTPLPSPGPLSPPSPLSPLQGQTQQGAVSSQVPLPSPAPLPSLSSSPLLRPPPTPPQGSTAVVRQHTPTPPPPTIFPAREVRSAAAEMWGEDTPVPTPAPKEPARVEPARVEPARVEEPPRAEAAPPAPAPSPGARPIAASPPATEQSGRTLPLNPAERERTDDGGSVQEIDIQELADRAEVSGEFEVDVDADADAEEIKTQESGAVEERPRSQSIPPMAASAAAPGPAVPPAPSAAAPPAGPPVQPAGAPAGAAGAAAKDGHAHAHAHPPPPPPAALHHHTKAPPTPPQPAKKDGAAKAPAATPSASAASSRAATASEVRPRGKGWFVEVFDEDYLRTLPFLTPQATQAEAEFVANAMGLTPGAQVLDIGCGYGRHAMELAARGFHVVGLDLSTPLLLRGGEEAQRRGLQINFVRGDMRELDFDAQFDGAYCLFSTFGYFDDETNKRTVAAIAHALKPGGRVLIEILNRDYVIADLPTRVWWEGDGCVVLEEVELNYFSSRIQVNRSVVFDDGRQVEQEISIRAYSLHEVGKIMHAAGFRVLEVSGGYQTRGRFFGNQSRHIIVLAERKDPVAS